MTTVAALRPSQLYGSYGEEGGGQELHDDPAALAMAAWKRKFTTRQIIYGINDPSPFQPGRTLGSGGLGIVVETTIDDVPVAWKRTYTRRLDDRCLNEIKVLGHMSEKRHKHIVQLIGSYIHRQKRIYELGILIWPVAYCDLSVLLHEVDNMNHGLFWAPPRNFEDELHMSQDDQSAFIFVMNLVWPDLESEGPGSYLECWDVSTAISARLLRSIGCVAEAVCYLHEQGIRHKDIKPSQILISSDGLWLTDFGWSKDTSQMTNSQTSGGDTITTRYHAPERAEMRTCGRSEDIFALGCTYLEMLYRVYHRAPKTYLNPKDLPMWSFQGNLDAISTWLAPFWPHEEKSKTHTSILIRRMLGYNPDKRPTIQEVLTTLRNGNTSSHVEYFGSCCRTGTFGSLRDMKAVHDGFSTDITKGINNRPSDRPNNSTIGSKHPILPQKPSSYIYIPYRAPLPWVSVPDAPFPPRMKSSTFAVRPLPRPPELSSNGSRPFYPHLPWLSVPDAIFPPRAPRRRKW